jgi:DNA repair protein RadC
MTDHDAAMTAGPGPRERALTVGLDGLSDSELVALLLGTGGRGEPVARLSARLLEEVGGLGGLERHGPGGLAGFAGLGRAKAYRLLAALELGRRAHARPLRRGTAIVSSRDVDAALRPRLARADQEHFIAIPLDAKNRPMGEIRIASGGLTACPVVPGDVFRNLVREAAAGVVFAHNHPSGEPTPSAEDIALTERLRRAGELLGLRVLDHVIVGHDGYFSFLDAGLLSPAGARAWAERR